MRFFLKVLVLVVLIVIGKVAKQSTIQASDQADSITYPEYSQIINNSAAPGNPDSDLVESDKGIQKTALYFNY